MLPFRQAGNADNALQFGGVVLWSKRRARTIVPYQKLFNRRFGAVHPNEVAGTKTLAYWLLKTPGNRPSHSGHKPTMSATGPTTSMATSKTATTLA